MSTEAPSPDATPGPIVVVDFGKKKRKQVKRLRKGRGRLVDDVRHTVDDLVADGILDDTAQVVVVVVEKKAKRRRRWL